ncbi:MAG TPA: DUF4097 family beta strand repeat-containing protein, partial [Thermoanaerobaculia bacterium]|nr:DUF4097 family beta strand repeat-containing protein [Thermoanaerobaculia bacterium]
MKRSTIPVLGAAVALLFAANAFAGKITRSETLHKDLPLDVIDSLWVDNPLGSVEVIGTDTPGLVATIVRTVTADDASSLKEGFDDTVVSFEGDRNVRLVRTILPRTAHEHWTSTVSYSLRVPRTVHVKIASKLAGRIRVANIAGNVTVTSFAAGVILDGVYGASIVEITNGRVLYLYHDKPSTNAQIQAVNADIDIVAPPDSNFNWIADTLRGDIVTNLPVRAEFLGNAFRGTVNGANGPTISMQTLLGNIRILGAGLDASHVQSVRSFATEPPPQRQVSMQSALMMQPAKRIQLPISGGPFDFIASVASVDVGEVRGWARVQTAAGEIKLGVVYGDCSVKTNGGPLDIGDVMGTLNASTDAGDVLVRSAQQGGHVSTAGGIIRVLYTAGPTTLVSGGGDITVRQAAGPVSAETHSGDINITADPLQRTEHIQAHTQQGNIAITVSPKFAADIDATVLTSRPDANAIRSDFPGLTIKRDQLGSKTRIHATGKLNGGGDKMELVAEEGDIRISNVTASP